MSFKDSDGSAIPFEQVEALANNKNISIRSGCFCNPGIDEITNYLTEQELSKYFLGRSEGGYQDMVDYLQKSRGSIRVSVGIATNKNDLDQFISFVEGLKD
jgi:selenocysteine lyase/cysteine desulfurase